MAGACHFLYCFILSISLGSLVHARMFKRVDSSLKTVTIPLSIDENQRYVVAVSMSSNPAQTFGFGISTSTGYNLVASASCDSCSDVSGYNQSASSSAQSLSGSQNVQFLSGSASGPLVKENCNLVEQNGLSWPYPNQTIIMANQSSSIFSSKASGIFGLGTNSQTGNLADTVFGGWLARNPTQSNFSFGMALNPPKNSSPDGGVLHWVSPDSTFFETNVAWKNVTSDPNSTTQSDWRVDLDALSFSSNNNNITVNSADMTAIFDPFYPNIYVPSNEAQVMYNAIPNSILSLTSPMTQSSVWTIPCETKMNLSVTFGSNTFVLDESVLVVQNGSFCTGLIEGWIDTTVDEYLFGANFISSTYMIFVIPQDGSGSLASIGFANRVKAKKASTGQIVGATLGSIAALGAIIISFYFIYRSRSRSRKAKRDSNSNVVPFPPRHRKSIHGLESEALLLQPPPPSHSPFKTIFPEGQTPIMPMFHPNFPAEPYESGTLTASSTLSIQRNDSNTLHTLRELAHRMSTSTLHSNYSDHNGGESTRNQDFTIVPFHQQTSSLADNEYPPEKRVRDHIADSGLSTPSIRSQLNRSLSSLSSSSSDTVVSVPAPPPRYSHSSRPFGY